MELVERNEALVFKRWPKLFEPDFGRCITTEGFLHRCFKSTILGHLGVQLKLSIMSQSSVAMAVDL